VFHVGLFKKFVGTPPAAPPQLPPVHHGAIVLQPSCALMLRFEGGAHHALVQWEGLPPSAASWEDLDKFKTHYPQFQLEDELFAQGRGGVMLCGARSMAGARGTNQASQRLRVIVS
jgi:hypothetical protein